jgi:hypothetical protein
MVLSSEGRPLKTTAPLALERRTLPMTSTVTDPRTLEPVTLSGWYEHADGTVGYYHWARSGVLETTRVLPSWAAVAAWEANYEADLLGHARAEARGDGA